MQIYTPYLDVTETRILGATCGPSFFTFNFIILAGIFCKSMALFAPLFQILELSTEEDPQKLWSEPCKMAKLLNLLWFRKKALLLHESWPICVISWWGYVYIVFSQMFWKFPDIPNGFPKIWQFWVNFDLKFPIGKPHQQLQMYLYHNYYSISIIW